MSYICVDVIRYRQLYIEVIIPVMIYVIRCRDFPFYITMIELSYSNGSRDIWCERQKYRDHQWCFIIVDQVLLQRKRSEEFTKAYWKGLYLVSSCANYLTWLSCKTMQSIIALFTNDGKELKHAILWSAISPVYILDLSQDGFQNSPW